MYRFEIKEGTAALDKNGQFMIIDRGKFIKVRLFRHI